MSHRQTTKRTQDRTSHSQDLTALVQRFLMRMQVQNYADSTVTLRRAYLSRFLTWCDARGIQRIEDITRDVLLAYQRSLFYYRSPKTGKPLKFTTQFSLLNPVRAWFRFLLREAIVTANPAADLELPKDEERLPTGVLTIAQVEAILAAPDVTQPLGIRDRAILETFYSTAMRRAELIGLQEYDVDSERGMVTIRHGKGRKDRVVPIGERALRWLRKYTCDVRPALIDCTQTGVLFVSCTGQALAPTNVSTLVRRYVLAAGINLRGSCHLFRHATATQMLENGADIRSLQSMLGHSQITTTQIYTRISNRHLKAVHRETHRAEKPQNTADNGKQDRPT